MRPQRQPGANLSGAGVAGGLPLNSPRFSRKSWPVTASSKFAGMLDKIGKVFGKKTFKGQGRKLGSSEAGAKDQQEGTGKLAATNKSTSPDPPAPNKAARDGNKANTNAFRGKPQRLGDSTARTQSRPLLDMSAEALKDSEPAEASYATAGASPDEIVDGSTSQAADGASAPDFQLLEEGLAQEVASEELQSALAQLNSGGDGPKNVLKRLFANILRQPSDTKFRRIRLGNPKIQAAIVDADGGLEMLQACGFQVVMDENEDGVASDAYAVLPEDDELVQMNAALVLLGYTHPSPAQKESTSKRAAAGPIPSRPLISNLSQPCDRKTEVVLSSGPEAAAQVPEWVFKRTPAELKDAMLKAKKKREQSEMLMTRAMREKLRVGPNPVYSQSTVRVRLPEGLLLQGCFNADERVAAIYDWVTDCLADPSTTYELVLPNRKTLVTAMGTLRSADLLPNVLLIFRGDEGRKGEQRLTVKQELMMSS